MNNIEQADDFTVEVDSILESIVPEFLGNRKKDCELIRQLLDKDDFHEIRTLGHRMKGAGGSYGFDLISEIGEIVENAALKADHETIRAEIQRLADYLERVSVVYV
ncbi:MAG: Hpt domain-containing protein [Steroidobacteraceae bacterium]|nr:Hpt domain-containing protein [Deltaproteobacteria bacterium]